MYLFSLDMVKNGSKVFRTKMRKAEDLLELYRLFSAEKRRIERKRVKVMKNFKEYAFGASMGQYQPVANLGDFAGKSYYGEAPC